MTAQTQLEAYLSEFRRRLKALILARGAAVLAMSACALTLMAVYLGTRRAFNPEFISGARALLLVVLALVVAVLMIYPLRMLRRTRGIKDIERRAPDFDGRVETYDGLARPAASSPRASPFLALLAEDTLKFARRIPVAVKVPTWEISAPALIGALAVGALIWFAAFGPDNWRYGVRHLWAGWAFSDTLPPQRIVVTPGDTTVRRGGDLPVEALPEGFDPTRVEVFALFEGGEAWDSATMAPSRGDGFDFTFFAVREPLRYYVTAAGVRSPEYRVEVVDLPQVEGIKLTYRYPQWTRLEPRTEDPGGDIRAVAGTEVLVEINTDRPLAEARLVANGEAVTMRTQGTVASASIQVAEDGEYHIATLFNQDPVRMTDDYFITLIPDSKPVVKVVKPGRDWRASNIEEVSVRVEASDDFGLERFELRYAINGGEWQVASLDADGNYALAEQTLYLEDMDKPQRPRRVSRAGGRDFQFRWEDLRQGLAPRGAPPVILPGEAEQQTEDAPSRVALEPGDLISYYAVAEDRGQSVRTDLFFVEVQPFERTYSQSMQGGGGGGGGGGQQQDEISRRQKEILVATWNLIQERAEEASYLDEQQLKDNALMLAELQRTLAEQARTLASRTRARQLTSVDDQIQTFVESLEQAAEAMTPAADRLADVELQEAVPSEQEALQHLLRAESVFTDIQVAFQRGGGGGGGLAGRDLSELFELEMDLEKNQYETEAPVAFDAPQNQVDEAIAKLQELARRQENLARQANRRNALSEQERWQQEMLRRETEELKRQLEELQRQAANQQSQQSQQGGQASQGGESSGQPSDSQGGGQSGSQSAQTERAIRQLEEALQAMNRAGVASDRADADPEQVQRAIEQARRQLAQALEQMTAQRQAQAEAVFSDLAERSRSLHEEQRQVAAELQQSMRAALDARDREGRLRSTLDRESAYELAGRKSRMREELEALERDIQRVAQQFRGQAPGASERLEESLTDLQQSQAIARLGYAAESIRRGGAPQVAATEGVTTSALRDLERGTGEALSLASREVVEGEQRQVDPTQELLAELQALRRELAELSGSERGLPGGQGQPGQPGQAGQAGQEGRQAGAANGGGGDRFGAGGGGWYDRSRGSGLWDPLNGGSWLNPERLAELEDRLGEAGRELLTQATRLRAEGLTDQELDAVRELGDALRRGLRGNPELIAREFQALVNLAEQLELKLRAGGESGSERVVRTEAPSPLAPGYEEAVAEYFRRLSRSEP